MKGDNDAFVERLGDRLRAPASPTAEDRAAPTSASAEPSVGASGSDPTAASDSESSGSSDSLASGSAESASPVEETSSPDLPAPPGVGRTSGGAEESSGSGDQADRPPSGGASLGAPIRKPPGGKPVLPKPTVVSKSGTALPKGTAAASKPGGPKPLGAKRGATKPAAAKPEVSNPGLSKPAKPAVSKPAVSKPADSPAKGPAASRQTAVAPRPTGRVPRPGRSEGSSNRAALVGAGASSAAVASVAASPAGSANGAPLGGAAAAAASAMAAVAASGAAAAAQAAAAVAEPAPPFSGPSEVGPQGGAPVASAASSGPSPVGDAPAVDPFSAAPVSASAEFPATPPFDPIEDGTAMTELPPTPETSDVHTVPLAGGKALEDDEALEFPPAPMAGAADAFAEFEDELEAENTRIDDSHLLAEQSTALLEDLPEQPFLAVEKGNDHGREFVLQEGLNGIGRGIDNDVILADVSVSRRHLTITREGGVLRMKDLGSGNGTQVNGRRISQVVLGEGDRLELGETILVVRIPGAPVGAMDAGSFTDENMLGGSLPPPAPTGAHAPYGIPNGPGYMPEHTPSATSAPVLPARQPKGAIVLPKPLFLSIILGGAVLLAMFGAAVAVLVVSGSGDDEATETAYGRGVRAYRASRWSEAESAFSEAIQEAGEHPEAQDYLNRIPQVREDERHLIAARAAARSEAWEVVQNETAAVSTGGPFGAEAAELRARASAALLLDHRSRAERALASNDLATATREVQVARNLEIADPELTALEARIAAARAALEAPSAGTPEAAPDATEADSPQVAVAPTPRPRVRPRPRPRPTGRRATGRRTGSRPTPTPRPTGRRGTAASSSAARLAAAARDRNASSRCRTVRSVLARDRGNAQAQRMSRACESEAQGLLSRARGQRGPAQRATLNRVLTMVPPNSSTYQAAARMISSQRRPSSGYEDEDQ